MADNRLFSPPGVVAMGNALSSRISRPNLYEAICLWAELSWFPTNTVDMPTEATWGTYVRQTAIFGTTIWRRDLEKGVDFQKEILVNFSIHDTHIALRCFITTLHCIRELLTVSNWQFAGHWALVQQLIHHILVVKTFSAPPKKVYKCVISTQRRYSEKNYQEITTANWGLATTNQPTKLGNKLTILFLLFKIIYF